MNDHAILCLFYSSQPFVQAVVLMVTVHQPTPALARRAGLVLSAVLVCLQYQHNPTGFIYPFKQLFATKRVFMEAALLPTRVRAMETGTVVTVLRV